MVLKKGITGFGHVSSLTINEINSVLEKIKYPYLYSNIIEPQVNNNYFCINIYNLNEKPNFKILINNTYYIIAGITMGSEWMNLHFIDLPNDFIKQIKGDEIIILNKSTLETKVPNNEINVLDDSEIKQINYWGSKTYGEIIFNGYD